MLKGRQSKNERKLQATEMKAKALLMFASKYCGVSSANDVGEDDIANDENLFHQ